MIPPLKCLPGIYLLWAESKQQYFPYDGQSCPVIHEHSVNDGGLRRRKRDHFSQLSHSHEEIKADRTANTDRPHFLGAHKDLTAPEVGEKFFCPLAVFSQKTDDTPSYDKRHLLQYLEGAQVIYSNSCAPLPQVFAKIRPKDMPRVAHETTSGLNRTLPVCQPVHASLSRKNVRAIRKILHDYGTKQSSGSRAKLQAYEIAKKKKNNGVL